MKRLQKYQNFVNETKKINEGFIVKTMKFIQSVMSSQIILGYILEGKFKKAKYYLSDDYNDFMETVANLSEYFLYLESLSAGNEKPMDSKELDAIIEEYKLRYHSNLKQDMTDVKSFMEKMAADGLFTGHLMQQYEDFSNVLEMLEKLGR